MTSPSHDANEYDVGILGWWYGKNYGSILTYYGLNRAVESLGYKALMVHEPLGYNGYRVKWPTDILSMKFARRVGYNYTEQFHYRELPELNAKVDTFLLGSDQLWNPLIGRVNDDLFLDFASPNNRRVAYATSFGNRDNAKFKPEFIEKHRPNLQNFSAISVREKYAVDTARNIFNVEATQTVDPVFLLDRDHYENLADQATVKQSGEYLAVFYLDPNPEKKATVLAVAKKLGLEKILIIPNPDNGRHGTEQLFNGPEFEILPEDAPENFLEAYRKASYVITDSFHGTAFAVIFNKPFSSIYNTKRGVDRFKSLLGSLGFGEKRRIHQGATLEKMRANANVSREIDFTVADRYISEGRKESLRWLNEALTSKIPDHAAPAKIATAAQPHQTVSNTAGTFGSRVGAHLNSGKSPAYRAQFKSNNTAWKITSFPQTTRLRLSGPEAAILGNHAFCDLPYKLGKDLAYRLTIRWKIRTNSKAVNLHIRNPDSKRFHVIGSASTHDTKNIWQIDTVDFVSPAEGYSQFMLGSVHFSGRRGGAVIESISVQEIDAASTLNRKPASGAAQVSKKLALDDHSRFSTALSNSNSAKNKKGARARMMFHAHAIEKGLSRSDFRAGFGKISVPALAREMNLWLKTKRDPQDVFFQTAAAVMQTYHARHETLKTDISDFWNLFAKETQKHILQADTDIGGVLAASATREATVATHSNRSFLDVVYGRRSIREFTDAPVDNTDIEHAVQIAMQAPSVCNRQGARVHQFRDPKAIKAALDIQGGFSGYKMPPRLLLVTVDLNAFLFASERNQPFVDGGLFMMSLLLGLEGVGLAGCSLNTAMNTDREAKIREILNIPAHEVFISFIAVGHHKPNVLTPRSKRISVDEVLVRHNGKKLMTAAV